MTAGAGPGSGPVSASSAAPARLALAGLLFSALAACQHEAGRLSDLGPAPDRPPVASGDVSHVTVGRRMLAQNRPEAALKSFNLAMIEEGVGRDALLGAADANYRLGRLNLARRLLLRTVELYPDSAAARNNLGVIHYQLGEYAHARAAFNAAYALESGLNDEIERNLAVLDIAEERAGRDDVEVADPDYYVVPQGGGLFKLVQAKEIPE